MAKCSTSQKWGRLVCVKWEAVIQRGENAIIITGIGQNELPSALIVWDLCGPSDDNDEIFKVAIQSEEPNES